MKCGVDDEALTTGDGVFGTLYVPDGLRSHLTFPLTTPTACDSLKSRENAEMKRVTHKKYHREACLLRGVIGTMGEDGF